MYKLFDFQQKAVTNCTGFFFNSFLDSALCVMPTASGKSVVIAEIAKKLDNFLILVPSEELLSQNERALINTGKIPSIYCASVGRKELSTTILATIGSVKTLGKELKKLGITNVICDEAHYKLNFKSDDEKEGMFKKLLKDLKPKKVLGLTATPFENSSIGGRPATRMLNKVRYTPFKEIIHITQFKEVIDAKRWQTLTYIEHPVSSECLKQGSSIEYTEDSIKLFLKENEVNNRVCLLLKQLQKEKTLTFTDSLDTAIRIRDWYNSKGFTGVCEVVSGDMPKKERRSVIEKFKDKNSDLNHVINYGTLTTGFDYENLKYVICGRPTNSLQLYYQICGRGGRVSPDKTFCIFHDLVGNVKRFGRVEKFNFDNINGMGWRMFSDNVCLTDIPQPSLLKVTKEFLKNPPRLEKCPEIKLWFGKYQGKDVRYVPSVYKDYLLKNFTINSERDRLLIEAIKISEKNKFIKEVMK